jgi:hypothetical protein
VTLGRAPHQAAIFQPSSAFCDGKLSPASIYSLLHRDCHKLFPDEAFADLFKDVGRRSVPPRIVAVVMVLQRLEGLSDRDAVERFTFDLRWKYAAGGLELEYPSFVHTVLVDMRARLRASEAPNRIFDTVLNVAREAGLVGRRRVLDSTALYDAVATQDTVTLIRSALRQLLGIVDPTLEARLRGVLKRDDDYATAGKPTCDWDDASAREALIDALAQDAHAVLKVVDDLKATEEVAKAATLLATVVGQDVESTDDGRFRIARRVAPDRVISTVDPEARHGHKTAARSFDGYKGHIAIDPDSEIITASNVTPGNVADGEQTKTLLAEILPEAVPTGASVEPVTNPRKAELETAASHACTTTEKEVTPASKEVTPASIGVEAVGEAFLAVVEAPTPEISPAVVEASAPDAGMTIVEASAPTMTTAPETLPPIEVFGDGSYGTADVLMYLEAAGAVANTKVLGPVAPDGHFTKDAFDIDLDKRTVTCPAGCRVRLRLYKDGSSMARFGAACSGCLKAPSCSTSKSGRFIRTHPHERILSEGRKRQKGAAWRKNYRATRPKVERKIAHLMRHRHGGRRARVRGTQRIAQDFALLCAAENLRRIARLRLPIPKQPAPGTGLQS